MTSKKLRWGILGTGRIAHVFANGVAASNTGQLTAVCSRSAEKAKAFAEEWKLEGAYDNLDAFLADEKVDAVYIATPHPEHARAAVLAAQAGKHILCEKPMTLNYAEALLVEEAAEAANIVFMEAFMYRCHPQIAVLKKWIQDGEIGELQSMEASFGFRAGFSPESRLFNPELGGGGILDVGCYALSLVRAVAGWATGKDFADPTGFTVRGRKNPETGTDEETSAFLRFPNDIEATIATGVRAAHTNQARLHGSKGWILLEHPWAITSGKNPIRITLNRDGAGAEVKEFPADINCYSAECDAFAETVFSGKTSCPAMPLADSVGNMRSLDMWRHKMEVIYPAEERAASIPSLSPRSRLDRHTESEMPKVTVPGVPLPVSQYVMGCDNQLNLPFATVMFDRFFAEGGNAFDTAFMYHRGLMENLLGKWMEARGVRDQVVVIAKGGHTPHCNPVDIEKQLRISLERLRTDRADIYMMHRDNLDIPAGEFIDLLNRLADEGIINAFGGSNWTLERVQEANEYAAAKGLRPFSVVSNNFSLARMVNPVWGGCVAASEPAFREWLEVTQTTHLAWSSQARGFFVRSLEEHSQLPAASEEVNSWHSPDNFKRRERAVLLARHLGVKPVQIAAAYVTNQAFPSIALIGPRTPKELDSSLQSRHLKLDPATLAWLDLRSDLPPAGLSVS